jgi:hypothetical protein
VPRTAVAPACVRVWSLPACVVAGPRHACVLLCVTSNATANGTQLMCAPAHWPVRWPRLCMCMRVCLHACHDSPHSDARVLCGAAWAACTHVTAPQRHHTQASAVVLMPGTVHVGTSSTWLPRWQRAACTASAAAGSWPGFDAHVRVSSQDGSARQGMPLGVVPLGLRWPATTPADFGTTTACIAAVAMACRPHTHGPWAALLCVRGACCVCCSCRGGAAHAADGAAVRSEGRAARQGMCLTAMPPVAWTANTAIVQRVCEGGPCWPAGVAPSQPVVQRLPLRDTIQQPPLYRVSVERLA